MSHMPPTASRAAVSRPDLRSPSTPPSPGPPRRQLLLDRDSLHRAVRARQRALAETETEMVAACEQIAAHGAARTVRMDDRATWDRATWQRYLDAAARLEPDYGPRLRQLHQEIARLDRLIALPLAA